MCKEITCCAQRRSSSQVPLKCRLHRQAAAAAAARQFCCRQLCCCSQWSKCYFAKKRFSGEIAAFNTSRGLSTIDSRNFIRSPLQSSVPLAAVNREASLAVGCIGTSSWNGQLGPDTSAEVLKWVRRRRGFSWDGERCWQGAVLLVLGFAGSGVDSLPVTSI